MLQKTISIFFFLASVIFCSACSSDLFNQTPKCSDTGAVNTLKSILDDDSRTATINVDTIIQTDLNTKTGMRTCTATVNYTYQGDGVMSSFMKGFSEASGISKNNKITYTLIMNDKGDKYVVEVLK